MEEVSQQKANDLRQEGERVLDEISRRVYSDEQEPHMLTEAHRLLEEAEKIEAEL